MPVRGMKRAIIGVAVLGAATLGAAQAFGAAEPITASTANNIFDKPSFAIDQGEVASFVNAGSTTHNVFAGGRGPDGEPLFESATIGAGQAPVNGTQYLTAGTYPFVCTIHPGMAANLQVTANGAPAARPQVTVKVLSSDIDQVVQSRKLRVKLSAATQSAGVSVVARKGGRRLGSKQNLDLSAGASRTLKIPLTGAGRKALKDLASAQVKVTAAVPFGSPDSAKRRLH
jgi:plastocyanin